MGKLIILGSMVLGLTGPTSDAFADEEGKPGINATSMKVSGVMSKVQSGHVTV